PAVRRVRRRAAAQAGHVRRGPGPAARRRRGRPVARGDRAGRAGARVGPPARGGPQPADAGLAGPGPRPPGAGAGGRRGGGPGDVPTRFFLWIDGVGGYLVCQGNRLTFGQAGLDARVDVPLVADVSRLHATVSRDAEGYLLEAVRPIQVNGATVTRALLQAGDRVTLGATCQ